MFCYTGSLVLEEANNLRRAIYDMPWYDYTKHEKQLLQLMLMRTLKQDGFSAFNYFYCNNQFFQQVQSFHIYLIINSKLYPKTYLFL